MPNTHTTLTSLFSDIADAIREKTGDSADIVADEFPEAISDIETGGQQIYYGEAGGACIPYTKVLNFPYDGLPGNLGKLLELEEVHAPEYTGTLNVNLFLGDTKLRVLDLPKATSANRVSFAAGCTALETVYFPKSADIGGALSFLSCRALVNVQFGSVGNPITTLPTATNIFQGCTSQFLLTIYVSDDAELPLPNQPWGATNATIVYRSATTGEVITP